MIEAGGSEFRAVLDERTGEVSIRRVRGFMAIEVAAGNWVGGVIVCGRPGIELIEDDLFRLSRALRLVIAETG